MVRFVRTDVVETGSLTKAIIIDPQAFDKEDIVLRGGQLSIDVVFVLLRNEVRFIDANDKTIVTRQCGEGLMIIIVKLKRGDGCFDENIAFQTSRRIRFTLRLTLKAVVGSTGIRSGHTSHMLPKLQEETFKA